MRPPTDVERENLTHMVRQYDPVKAREYYLRTRKLKGRQKGTVKVTAKAGLNSNTVSVQRSRKQISKDARTKQRKELAQAIQNMEERLKKLEALIKKRASDEKSEDRKGKAKKERSAKENEKPKSAAEKAKASRENEKYRDKNQQKLKSKAKKDGKSGGGSAKGGAGGAKKSVSELKNLATRVRGQIAVAKQKLAAL